MKKHRLISLLAILLLPLSSCDISINIPPFSGDSSSHISSTSTDDSSTSSSSSASSSSSSTSSSSSSTSQEEAKYSIVLNSANVFLDIKYDTNFSTVNVGSHTFNFYRYGKAQSDGFFRLISSSSLTSCVNQSLTGAIYNEYPIYGIKKIDIEASNYSDITLMYGQDELCVYELENVTNENNINSNDVNFFRIEAKKDVDISSVTIYYTNVNRYTKTAYQIPAGYRQIVTSSTPNEGDTKSILVKENNSYISKSYTYHTFEYAKNNVSELNEIALTDPSDVMNYYLLFGAVPANFGCKSGSDLFPEVGANEYSYTVKNVFNDQTRTISRYNKTTGYTTSIPYSGGYYYELDIAISDVYSTSNRDVGRLVLFPDGFTCYEDKTPVGLLTTDHYITFCEYSNASFWNALFDTYTSINDGHGHRTFKTYTACNTVTI